MAARIAFLPESALPADGLLGPVPVVSADLPLIAGLGIEENMALPRRMCGPQFQRGAEEQARAMLHRLGRADLLENRPVPQLSREETLIVKCLAAMLSPAGRFVVHCGGHLPRAQQEADILKTLFATFAERLGVVHLIADAAIAACFEPLLTEIA